MNEVPHKNEKKVENLLRSMYCKKYEGVVSQLMRSARETPLVLAAVLRDHRKLYHLTAM